MPAGEQAGRLPACEDERYRIQQALKAYFEEVARQRPVRDLFLGVREEERGADD